MKVRNSYGTLVGGVGKNTQNSKNLNKKKKN
jgi:hypothetical protein